MKYFIDTEFIEGFHKPLFGKRRHFIDLVSIALVAEDGRSYYAISNEWNYKDAHPWVKENIIHKLPLKLRPKETFSEMNKRCKIGIDDFDKYTWLNGKSNTTIAQEIKDFIYKPYFDEHPLLTSADYYPKDAVEFYGYYSDYDWVLFCSLFGSMSQLPKGFPMYCRDLNQTQEEIAASIDQVEMTNIVVKESDMSKWITTAPIDKKIINIDDYTLGMKVELLKTQQGYPKQTNEHNALADARWNYELYKFLQTK